MANCDVNILMNALGIQQIGPRTVIVPADPIIWDETKSYEYLTIVASSDYGQAYISKRDVPSGTPLTNTDYWIPAATFNAQLAEIMRQLADKASIADLTALKTSLEESIAAIGTVSGIVDNDKGFVQDSTNAVMLPGVGASMANGCDLYGMASLISTWINSTLKLGYDNINTFKYVKNSSGGYDPYMPTDHMNNGYLPIDCATFTEMVANNMTGTSSPYSGSPYLTSQGPKMFNYTDPTVIRYWSFMGGNAGRMLTWQWAKYLYDRGLLYVGRFSPKPGMHVFFGNTSEHPDTYLGIYHCGIVTNYISSGITGGSDQCWGIDVGGISSSPTTNTIAERIFDTRDIVACFYPTSIGLTQNTMNAFNYIINTNNEWHRDGRPSVDVLFNTTGSPVTFHYKATFANDTDGTKGGIDTDLTLGAFQAFRIVRVANRVTLTNAKGIRIMGESFPGLAKAANENIVNDE